MKIIWLSQGQFTLVDDSDLELLSKWEWYAEKRPNTFYARGWAVGNGKKKRCYMHRLILGAGKGVVGDHFDGNGLNNQRYNIRACAQNENMKNQKPRVGYSSKFKGVYFHKMANKWTAQIKVDYKRMHLGLFESEVEAAIAYDLAAKKHFVEFAKPNFK